MKTLIQQLGQYAAYHRDRRNVVTHFVGIPMIVLAATILLSHPGVDVGGWFVSAALVAAVVLTLYYLKLDLRYGIAMGVFLAVCLARMLSSHQIHMPLTVRLEAMPGLPRAH